MATSSAREPLQQPTEPLDVDGVSAMAVGTAAWALALVVLLLTGTRFGDDDGWWLWVCIVGAGIGAVMVLYTRRRRAAYRAARAAAGAD